MNIKKKAAAVLISVMIICSSLCVTVGVYQRNSGFVPRMTAPSYSDSCYYEDNIFYQSGFGIPNCTAYAWGRAYELLGKEPKLCTGNARDWYSYNKNSGVYEYGQTPRLGAIACFDNDLGGHVAVVEKIERGEITFSNSAYMGREFYLSTADISDSNPGQDGWDFQGYIYIGDFDHSKVYLNANRKISTSDGLNLRAYPSTNAEILTAIPKRSEVFVTELIESDGFWWGKTSFEGESGYCVIEYTRNVI